MRFRNFGLALLAFALCGGCVEERADPGQPQGTSNGPGCADEDSRISVPEGFCAEVFAELNLGARHLAEAPNGVLYVAIRGDDGGIVALRDGDGDGRAEERARFGETGGTGIAVRDGYLYFASDVQLMRYRLGEQLVPQGEPEVLIGFAGQSSHASKPFAFDGDGQVYVNIGAPSNACQRESRTRGSPGLDPCPLVERSAGIWRFAPRDGMQQLDDGERYATGIRNAVAIAWNTQTNKLYVVQHGRDQLSELWPEHFSDAQRAELPAEEFFEVDAGDDFGWPYCYYDHLKGQKVLAPEYGGDGNEIGRCAVFEDPIVAFPGHWAPNDLLFYTGAQFPPRYRDGAFVAFHGSWNRQPFAQAGYRVSFVPFAEGKPSGEPETFADGFTGAASIRRPGDARYRPTGLAQAADGSLYIADSRRGRIWRVRYLGD